LTRGWSIKPDLPPARLWNAPRLGRSARDPEAGNVPTSLRRKTFFVDEEQPLTLPLPWREPPNDGPWAPCGVPNAVAAGAGVTTQKRPMMFPRPAGQSVHRKTNGNVSVEALTNERKAPSVWSGPRKRSCGCPRSRRGSIRPAGTRLKGPLPCSAGHRQDHWPGPMNRLRPLRAPGRSKPRRPAPCPVTPKEPCREAPS